MEKWQEKYKAKICSPDEAIQKIKSAKRISFGHICSESSVLTEALIRNKKLFKKLEIDHLLSIGKCEYAKEENSEYFHHNALFIGPKTREAANSSYGDYTPIFFYETAKIFGKDGDLSPDAMLLQVSTPDEHGYCSYGLSCDYTKSATESAKIVVAQINKFVPRTLGNCFIHIDDIDYIIIEDTPIPEIPAPLVGELEEKIGANCASLINDGDTLQLGIGAIPFAVLNFLKEKKDLGKIKQDFDKNIMPDLTGISLREFLSIYPQGKFSQYEITGSGKIVSQFPEKGTKLDKHTQIRIMLE